MVLSGVLLMCRWLTRNPPDGSQPPVIHMLELRRFLLQKKIGPVEKASVDAAIKQLSRYKVLYQDRRKKEAFFNHLLFRHLAQGVSLVLY